MDNTAFREQIRDEFKYFLEHVARSLRANGNKFNLGDTSVNSYLSYISESKLFDYAPEKWSHIESIYDITNPEEIKAIADELLVDEEFKKRDLSNSQGFRSGALMHYVCFINARAFYTQTKAIIKEKTEIYGLQIIFYGAPGTGKSFSVDAVSKKYKHQRITFHPDSDYSSFVGCYKPVMSKAEDKIVYSFSPQAFTNAYIEAWSLNAKKERVYLIIEEINRGNCAQIFGDLFQLLDRGEDGYSKYEITPDTELQKYIAKQGLFVSGILDSDGKDISAEINSGKLMKLPDNLYIWATMNTSDQSLFPIDSAFKRRWDWKYVPIDTHKENWTISVNGNLYDWGSFLDKINDEIEDTTSSEDKKLGFYFCKAEDGVISADRFVSKVLFYIYNDVFKDYGFDSREFFKDKDTQKPIKFQSFYQMTGEVNEAQVEKILKNLGVEACSNDQLEQSEDDQKKDGKHDFLSSVTIGDEKLTLENRTHFQLYMDTLKRIGLDKVFPIINRSKYKRLGCPLATLEKDDRIESHKTYSYVQEGDYFFIKGAADETLINVLKEIDTELNLGINIEIYR